jgi:tetratricopeptide (TPR) repeat protein
MCVDTVTDLRLNFLRQNCHFDDTEMPYPLITVCARSTVSVKFRRITMKPSAKTSVMGKEANSSQAIVFPSIASWCDDSTDNSRPGRQAFDQETEAIRLCEVGKLMLTANRFEDALDQFNQSLKVDPHFVDAWYHRADALACLNRYEDALESLEQAQELAGYEASHIWVQKAVVLILLKPL